jgi:hypothetical protein
VAFGTNSSDGTYTDVATTKRSDFDDYLSVALDVPAQEGDKRV